MEIIRKESSSAIQHIDTIIADIQDHVDKKQDFVAFILIALGIEFVGSFFDEKDFNDWGQSKTRFMKGLELFDNTWYNEKSLFIFQKLRGPLIHQYRTGGNFLLTSICKNNADADSHLTVVDNKRILVLECLFDHFKVAVTKLKAYCQKNDTKANAEYLTLYTINNDKILFNPNTKSESIPYASGNVDLPESEKDNPLYSYSKPKGKNKKK